MSARFTHHYSLDEARELLPQVREWLTELRRLRSDLTRRDEVLAALLAEHRDLGGERVEAWARSLGHFRALIGEFSARDIQIKDLDRGLIDFPAFREEREVFLCWEESEDDIAFWHDLDTGFAGRAPL